MKVSINSEKLFDGLSVVSGDIHYIGDWIDNLHVPDVDTIHKTYYRESDYVCEEALRTLFGASDITFNQTDYTVECEIDPKKLTKLLLLIDCKV